MRIENWNGNVIRFVEVAGEWCGDAKDISDALGYANASNMVKHVPRKYLKSSKMEDMNANVLVLTEFGIYKAIFGSHKPEAEQFQEWVFATIQQLRKSTGLEGFEVFRMLDKQHQKEAMARLCKGLKHPVRVNFIKANTIANKAVSTKHGYAKMVKKGDMTPEMLVEREPILDDTVRLMEINDEFGLDLSVSKAIYAKVG